MRIDSNIGSRERPNAPPKAHNFQHYELDNVVQRKETEKRHETIIFGEMYLCKVLNQTFGSNNEGTESERKKHSSIIDNFIEVFCKCWSRFVCVWYFRAYIKNGRLTEVKDGRYDWRDSYWL